MYAPRNPIVRKLRHPPGTSAVSKSSARNPIANDPVTLMIEGPPRKGGSGLLIDPGGDPVPGHGAQRTAERDEEQLLHGELPFLLCGVPGRISEDNDTGGEVKAGTRGLRLSPAGVSAWIPPHAFVHCLVIPTNAESHLGFSLLDYTIVIVYLAGVTVAGIIVAGRQKTSRDYFLGGKSMSWWSVGFSIVASETSTLTFISIPGLAYRSDMHFLQLVFGYFIGRLLVSVFFIPAYYAGDLETAYDFLGKRFGLSLRKFTSSVFITTRVLASGVRLFATAIPVHLITGLDYGTSILVIGVFTLIYTYLGGLKAVVAMDVVQMFIYLSGAVASMVLILQALPNGWQDVVTYATQNGLNKFEIVNLQGASDLMSFLASPYTLVGGILGGTFLTMASHGTDQLLVQRLLGCRSRWDSQKALMLDATFIVIQFAFFLVLGLCLFAFYKGVPFQELGLKSSDEIFPRFIVTQLPSGLAGSADRGGARVGDGNAFVLHQFARLVHVPGHLQDDAEGAVAGCQRGTPLVARADIVLGFCADRRRDAVYGHDQPGRGDRLEDRIVHLWRAARHVLPRPALPSSH